MTSLPSWPGLRSPSLEIRHRTGAKVFLFLIVAVGVFYAAKRKIWAVVH